jgi:dolichol-phosphate mannosyltransferase
MYDYVFEMDADFSHNPSELVTMLDYLKESKDMVIGSRYIKGINVVNWPLGRIILSYLASVYVRLITSMPIKDPTAGFVGYKREVLEAIQLDKVKFVGYAFQVEMKYKTWRKNFSYIEHPIIFTNRTLGLSKMDGGIIWEGLLGVLILRINDIFGLNK